MRQYTRQTIKRNLLAAMMLAPFVPVLLALGTGGYLFWTHVQRTTLDRLALLARHHVSQLDRYVDDSLGDLKLVGGQLRSGDPEYRLRAVLDRLRAKHPEVVDAALVDDRGALLGYAGPSVYKGTHIRSGRWLDEALEHGDSVGDVRAGQMGLPHFVLARRLSVEGQTVVLRASCDPEVFTRMLMDGRRDGVDMFLLSRSGEVMAGSTGQILTSDRELLRVVFPDFIGKTFRDTESGTAFSSGVLRYGGWMLVAREPGATLLGASQSALLFVGLSVLCGGLLVFVSSLYLTGYVEKMLVHRDEERESLREQLYRAGRLAELGEMAAGFAHEINNPLQIMKSEQAYMEMLLQDFRDRAGADDGFTKDVDEMASSVGQVRQQIDRCARITQSILKFGRAGSAEEQNLDVVKFVSEVVRMVQKKIELNNIDLTLDLSAERLLVHVDAGKLQQVLLNLLNNAMYAIGENTDGRAGAMTLTCLPDGADKVRISIADNGVGIDPARHQLIFTPFFTTKPAGSGTGLGLSLCHGLVAGMNGVLDFTSVPGRGSTFFIVLPRVIAGEK